MTNIWNESVADHKRRTEGCIIEVALELISEKGMSEVSMSELAQRAGVTRKTLYNYFPDLAHVMLAWMKIEIDRDYERIKQGIAGLEDAVEQLSFYVRSSLDSCAEREHHAGVEAAMSAEAAMSQEAWDQVSEKMSKTESILRGILQGGVKKGTFRKDIDIDTHAVIIFHLTGSLHHTMDGPDCDPERISNAIMDVVLNGIKKS